MYDVTAAIISKSLDALSVRQNFTAQNIANANTPEYRPVTVSFEKSLEVAASQGEAAVMALEPRVHYSPTQGVSGETRLDLELAISAQTAMRYSALVDILGRQMSLTRMVITGGQ